MVAMPVDVILAGDARCTWSMFCVQPQLRRGHAVAFGGGAAPLWIDRNIQPLSSGQVIDESRKAPMQKQEEFSRSRCAVDLLQEESETIAVHLETSGCAVRRRGGGKYRN